MGIIELKKKVPKSQEYPTGIRNKIIDENVLKERLKQGYKFKYKKDYWRYRKKQLIKTVNFCKPITKWILWVLKYAAIATIGGVVTFYLIKLLNKQ
jgi:hypothetical protein